MSDPETTTSTATLMKEMKCQIGALTAEVEELRTVTSQSNLGPEADGTRRGER